jgi:DNA-directed RNA polymerase subunit RPC12/RpoP
MTAPGLELLLRLVAEQLGARRCARCGRSLSHSRVALREHDAQQVVIEVSCRRCQEPLLLKVEPEAGNGVARIS